MFSTLDHFSSSPKARAWRRKSARTWRGGAMCYRRMVGDYHEEAAA
jgi:hypothetical protein